LKALLLKTGAVSFQEFVNAIAREVGAGVGRSLIGRLGEGRREEVIVNCKPLRRAIIDAGVDEGAWGSFLLRDPSRLLLGEDTWTGTTCFPVCVTRQSI
jgi:hypothetical protein